MNWLVTESPRPAWIARRPYAPWLVIATVCFGAFMGQLDASIVTLAFPAMSAHFGADPEWISLSYLITLVALLVPLGRIADRVGRKVVYVHGFALFTVASAACACAPTFGALIAARVAQAAGAAMLQANSVALVTAAVAPEQRRKALGVQAAAQAAGLAAGPLAGGYLTEHFGWQAVFAINVPVGVVAVVAGHYLLPRTRTAGDKGRATWKVLPGLVGVLLAYAALFAPMALLPFVVEKPLAEIGLTTAALPIGFAIAATTLHKRGVTTGALLVAIAPVLPVPQALQLVVAGAGLGIIAPACTKRVMSALPESSAGLGSGLVNVARGLGTALGVAVATALIGVLR
ncbi:Major Facilitator Superfamily protein [Lentzea xinjiangensis]|uniref:Major Facilitator Superfamily protein n=1 Tax=Lentzea xinjiangensis TaxID=402600 RepID=A0A1H9HNG4_9PSEU|nr:MFS transporter [Lentzea xinjiangensis]SEQ63762.1 Major Facilitator Superfamily protein [Lentzea xinjiangensis]